MVINLCELYQEPINDSILMRICIASDMRQFLTSSIQDDSTNWQVFNEIAVHREKKKLFHFQDVDF